MINKWISIFQLYHGEKQVIFQWDDDEVCWYSQRIDMWHHSRHIFLIKTSSVSSVLFSREAANTNFIVFGFTLAGLETMIYSTWGENANHYTIDVVENDNDNTSNLF